MKNTVQTNFLTLIHVEIGRGSLFGQSLTFPSTLHINGYDTMCCGDSTKCLYLSGFINRSRFVSNLSDAHQFERFALFTCDRLRDRRLHSICNRTSRLDCLKTLCRLILGCLPNRFHDESNASRGIDTSTQLSLSLSPGFRSRIRKRRNIPLSLRFITHFDT